MEYQAFVDSEKSLLIAPAGYGKTFTIVECLKYTTGKQLILTHTHAGVAAIKEKVKKSDEINAKQYSIETISSFAQKYAQAFYVGEDMPHQEDANNYHKFIIEQAIHIFGISSVQDIIKSSYSGLFVDEYQDCNSDQHRMIMAISSAIPTHVLGDPLQGIFDFHNGLELVNFGDDLNNFENFPELDTPHRWYQEGNNRPLGDHLKSVRKLLENNEEIRLKAKDDIGFHVITVPAIDIRDPRSRYRDCLNRLILNPENKPEYNSLLIISPEYIEIQEDGSTRRKGDISERALLRAQIDYRKCLSLLEAIDDRVFYSLAKKTDTLISNIIRARNPVNRIKNDVLLKVFNKSDISAKWFNKTGLVRKNSDGDKAKSSKLSILLRSFITEPSAHRLCEILMYVKTDLKSKYKREEILYSLMKALEQAALSNTSVYASMAEQRNRIRRSGRQIRGKCLGTTLLTKGLEFDTVAILDAHNFDCPKHLYVALTRACKKLVIFTESTTLSPYGAFER